MLSANNVCDIINMFIQNLLLKLLFAGLKFAFEKSIYIRITIDFSFPIVWML